MSKNKVFYTQKMDYLTTRALISLSFLTCSGMLISNVTILQNYPKISAQKYPNKIFLITNLGISILAQNLAIRQIRGC